MQNPSAYSEAPIHQRFSRQYPAIVHATVVTAFLAPITILPYLVARRQVNKLRQTVKQLERRTSVLQNALDLTADSHNITKSEVKRLQDLSRNAMEATASLRKEVMQQSAERKVVDTAISTDLRKLLEESQQTRVSVYTLRALGTSLADVAAFMQEVELDFGMNPTHGEDRRGIERLRLLARRMQSVDETVYEDPDDPHQAGDLKYQGAILVNLPWQHS